jgi:antitoxin ParD1/3/4
MTMTVDLGPKLDAFVEELIKTGRYQSKSEVLREGVRLVQDRESRLAALEAELQKGLDDIDAGRTKPMDEVFDALEAKYLAMAKARGE